MTYIITIFIIIIIIVIANIIKKRNDPTRKIIKEICDRVDEELKEADELLWDTFKKDLTDDEIKSKISEMKEKINNWTYLSKWYILDKAYSHVNLRKNEHIYTVAYVNIIKDKTIKDWVQYWWFTGRVSVIKWLTYRVWNINYTTKTHKESYKADHWELFITNEAIIFLGNKSSWRIQFNKIISIEVNQENWLCLIKKWWDNILFEIKYRDYRKKDYYFVPELEILMDMNKKQL